MTNSEVIRNQDELSESASSRFEHLMSKKVLDISDDKTIAEDAETVYRSIKTAKNKETGMTVDFVRATFGKLKGHRGDDPRVMGALKLFEDSVLMITEAPDFETPRADGTLHKDQSSNVVGYTHFINRFKMDGKNYFVRYTVRNLRTRNSDGNYQFHSQYVSEIELSSFSTETALALRGAELAASDLKLASPFRAVNNDYNDLCSQPALGENAFERGQKKSMHMADDRFVRSIGKNTKCVM